jgi:hypothetical protein
MREKLTPWFRPIRDTIWWAVALRSLWIAIQLIAVYCLSDQISPFFYQRF